MPTLGGTHSQAHTQRQVGYWATYDRVAPDRLFVAAVFTQGPHLQLGQWEGELTCGSAAIPHELRVRSALLSYIDRTAFGPGKQPDPHWIGWRAGAVL